MDTCRVIFSDWTTVKRLFTISCIKADLHGPIVVGLLSIVVLGVWLTYRRGWKTSVRITGWFFNYFFSLWPRWPYSHATIAIGVASIAIFLAFIPYTDNLIVNVTAVYATILFLEGTLRKEVPLLDVEFIRATSTKEYDTSLVDGDGNDDVIKQLVKLKNRGDADAENIQIKCRAVNQDGMIALNWTDVDLSGDGGNELPSNSEMKTEIYIDTVEEYEEQEYYTEIKIKPNVRLGHLTIRKIHKTKPES